MVYAAVSILTKAVIGRGFTRFSCHSLGHTLVVFVAVQSGSADNVVLFVAFLVRTADGETVTFLLRFTVANQSLVTFSMFYASTDASFRCCALTRTTAWDTDAI